ncbi:hypothetical protein M1O12_05330, partial [Dehalococcoidia bacterium]|nr:hypothetical protein [Dehalococcoidia bacterium]
MAGKKKSEEMLAQVKKDRLNKHLSEVEEVIERWITGLDAPPPFFWQPSEESESFGESSAVAGVLIRPADYFRLQPWKLWACRSVYVPDVERDTASNHMLRKHLRKRALWKYHTEWEQRLNRISEIGVPICQRATEMEDARAKGKDLTEDYKATALMVALEQALGHAPEKLYSQKAFRGVCYAGVVIEKSANAQKMNEVAEEHWQMASELGHSKEMLELAQEWQDALALQGRMKELAEKALKSSE